ncbi:MAG: MATE family efflux transporter, partial [Firmicutes bacterium]|nr:MATE family efflux transporter [Bacillota bacterium]
MPSDRTSDFSSGSIIRHLISFSLPMLLGNLLQALYNTVDSIWVGRFLGKEALAAVSVSFPVIFLLVAFVTGLTMAATVLVAQYAGARQPEMVRRTVANTIGLLVASGLVLSILGVVFHRAILRLIQTPPSIMPLASNYLSIYLSGLIFTFVYNAASSILRGLGDSHSPTIFLVYATVTNIILDPIFIFGLGPIPRLGVAGAAWATVIAQVLAAF